jgi:hypothetical protein
MKGQPCPKTMHVIWTYRCLNKSRRFVSNELVQFTTCTWVIFTNILSLKAFDFSPTKSKKQHICECTSSTCLDLLATVLAVICTTR